MRDIIVGFVEFWYDPMVQIVVSLAIVTLGMLALAGFGLYALVLVMNGLLTGGGHPVGDAERQLAEIGERVRAAVAEVVLRQTAKIAEPNS